MRKCDICNSKYSTIFNFGKQFLANHYIKHYEYNARVAYCDNCIILKCIHQIPNKKVFQKTYPYLSSLSIEFNMYLKKISKELKNKIKKGNILEIGSNDGSFLENFKFNKYKPVGLEPAFSSHKIAKKKIISINEYFDTNSSFNLKKKYESFELIFSINTFAHIDGIKQNLKLVRSLLDERKKKALFVFENIDISSLVRKNNFSQLYDEHVYTLSANSINKICKEFNLVLFDIKKTSNQNGSYRYYIANSDIKQKNSVKKIIQEERIYFSRNVIKRFFKNIVSIKKRAKYFFTNKNNKIFGYGASAKATFIANFLSLDKNCIKFIFDNSPYKINKYLPGTKIKIKKRNFN